MNYFNIEAQSIGALQAIASGVRFGYLDTPITFRITAADGGVVLFQFALRRDPKRKPLEFELRNLTPARDGGAPTKGVVIYNPRNPGVGASPAHMKILTAGGIQESSPGRVLTFAFNYELSGVGEM